MRLIETKPKTLKSPRADETGLREVTLALSPWAVESKKGLRVSQVGTD